MSLEACEIVCPFSSSILGSFIIMLCQMKKEREEKKKINPGRVRKLVLYKNADEAFD